MNRAVIILLMAIMPALSQAGYFATVLTRQAGTNYSKAIGTVSACYLIPSMAFASLNTYGQAVITAITDDTINGYSVASGAGQYTASYGTCSAVPAINVMPAFQGSLTDPILLNGSGGGGSTGGESSMIEALNPQLAIDDSLAFFGLAFLFLATIWAGRKVYNIFSGDS